MSFKYPYLLALIIPAILLLIYSHKYKAGTKAILYPFSNRGLNEYGKKSWGHRFIFLLRLLAISFIIVALARPQTSSSNTQRRAEGIDIVIALDVSKSMLIEDYRNGNRLDLAKRTVENFVKGRSDDRIGFLMFSGEAITLCPPTLDYEVVAHAIRAANVDQIKDGTAIGDALGASVARLRKSTAKSKVIILVTDGDNNTGSLPPKDAGALAKGYGIKVYSIALGKEGESEYPQVVSFLGQKRKQYIRVTSTINPKLLQEISKETGGKFYRAKTKGSLAKIFAQIDKLEKTKIETKVNVRWQEHFQKYLLFGLILLFLEFILSRTRYRVLPN